MEPSTYGERIADVYDEWYEDATDVHGTVATIVRLAGASGRVLELGIGTGRLALPMTAAGLEVHGVDASEAMVAKLRAKPGGGAIPVTIGDFSEPVVDGDFDVVLLAFNALLNLTSEEAQARCLQHAAARAPAVVVETFVPGDELPSSGVDVRHVDDDEVRLAAYRLDDGVVTGSLISIRTSGITLRPWRVLLSTPADIDRVASSAGLVVAERWSGWRGESFDGEADRVVTVYQRDER